MNVSIVIPTYNRLPILEKCLFALENQKLNTNISNYEVIVVDDGSTDGTSSWINKNKANLPHVILFQQEHGGPALGRNLGVIKSKYEIIIFIDSDLIVLDNFINCHVEKLLASWRKNDKKCFTYGSVVNTSNFLNPQSEKHKIMDTSFSLYGWEDLELGERLKKIGTKLIKCPNAVGFHWHPPFNCEQIDSLIAQ